MSEKPGKTLRTLARLSVLALAILALSVGALAAEAPKVRVGYLALPHYLLTPYTAEKGYDAEYGIKIDALNFTNGPLMIAAMAAGSLDIGLMACVPVINTSASNPDSVYVLSVFEDTTSVMSVATTKSNINKLEDLKGKKIAVPLGTGMHFFLELALKKAGLTTKDVTLLHAEPADAMYVMLSGEVDATVPFGGYLFSFLEKGGWPFFWGYQLVETEPKVDVLVPDVIVVSKKFADKYPERVVAFLAAYYKSVDDLKASPEAVLDWEVRRMDSIVGTAVNPTQKQLFTNRPTSVKGVFEKTPSWIVWNAEDQLALLKSGRVNKWFDEAADFFARQGVIPKKPKMDSVVNSTFMEQVVNLRRQAGAK